MMSVILPFASWSRHGKRFVFSAILVVAAGVPLHAQPPQVSKCHGARAEGQGPIPRLAGQHG